MSKIILKDFNSVNFQKGAETIKLSLWYFLNAVLIRPTYNPFIGLKVFLLRSFGAQIGRGVIIKPGVNIKFPWKLNIGEDVWIGENVWIDNLDTVTIGNNVCISQGAMLLTGNHDYTLPSFDYRNAPIVLENGVWIGAKSVVCPGVTCKSHSILAVGSVATKNLEEYSIYQGNPAVKIRDRKIKK
jgi:putative colanic acid biosynthesis acetyltransferase WcaF